MPIGPLLLFGGIASFIIGIILQGYKQSNPRGAYNDIIEPIGVILTYAGVFLVFGGMIAGNAQI